NVFGGVDGTAGADRRSAAHPRRSRGSRRDGPPRPDNRAFFRRNRYKRAAPHATRRHRKPLRTGQLRGPPRAGQGPRCSHGGSASGRADVRCRYAGRCDRAADPRARLPGRALLMSLHIAGVTGLPEVSAGDDLATLIGDATQGGEPRGPRPTPSSASLDQAPGPAWGPAATLRRNSVVVIAQKIVSKSEGAVVDLRTIAPSELARSW